MTTVDSCDVCIVGAGLAGLNALFAASRYLRADQKVVLLDRRPRVGGMWVDVYPYVRLHQPHGMFTAGNIAWTLDRDRGYLATKDEVLDHFAHCLAQIRQRVQVEEWLGWSYVSDTAHDGGVRVVCRTGSGDDHVLETGRLIKAYGFGIGTNDPLQVSSTRVRSVSPDFCDMRSGEIAADTAAVWIIGSGKTAMDTAHALITRNPGREINMLAGSGTFFSSRDRFFPDGAQRWWGGKTLSALSGELSHLFDGTNEHEVARWMRERFGTGPTARADNFLLGVLSEAESRTIAAGLGEAVMGHLVDAVDADDGVDLVLDDGAAKRVPAGSWLVNCTGYLGNTEQPYEPYTNADGTVLSIQTRSATMHFTSYEGYFMTHLMMLDKLRDIPLYALDLQELLHRSKAVMPFAMFTLARYNLGLIADAVPVGVFNECGLDFDRWYPWHRRTAAALRFMRTHRGESAGLRHTLDTIGERFEVRCGPLDSVLRASAVAAG